MNGNDKKKSGIQYFLFLLHVEVEEKIVHGIHAFHLSFGGVGNGLEGDVGKW